LGAPENFPHFPGARRTVLILGGTGGQRSQGVQAPIHGGLTKPPGWVSNPWERPDARPTGGTGKFAHNGAVGSHPKVNRQLTGTGVPIWGQTPLGFPRAKRGPEKPGVGGDTGGHPSIGGGRTQTPGGTLSGNRPSRRYTPLVATRVKAART